MASNRLPNVAVIGCGYWGKNLVRDFASLGVLSAVSDPNPEIATCMAETYGVKKLTHDAVMEAPDIDAVVIAAPAELHSKLALSAFASGKHVFVEKPISLDIVDAKKMISAAQNADKTLMVGHLLQYHPVFLKLKQMVRDDELGKIRHIYSRRLSLGKLRTTENVLWSFAPHDISMVLALVGAEPTSVTGNASAYLQEGISDFASVHMNFPNGVNAQIDVSWLNPFKEQRLVVVGEKAMADFCDSEPVWENKLKIYRHEASVDLAVPIVNSAAAELVYVEQANPLINECKHFLYFIQSGETPYTDGKEALSVLKVLHLADATAGTKND
jgi:predicted dehydrogenase